MLDRLTRGLVGLGLVILSGPPWGNALRPEATAAEICQSAVLTGEVHAGETYKARIGATLILILEPIASGWILRVQPASGPHGSHDYAELATPPYNSMSPLSVSTDFSFRAQDAIAWNPRDFQFATDRVAFSNLLNLYERLPPPGAQANPQVERQLASQLAHMGRGRLRILDAKLVAGNADQSKMAAAVALHFSSTAHTLDLDGRPSALGKIQYLQFQIELDLPKAFIADPSLRASMRPCHL